MQTKHLAAPAAIIAGVCLAAILSQILFPPKEGKSQEQTIQENQKEQITVETLQIQSLTRRIQTVEENIQRIYKNQVEINTAISNLVKNEETNKKANKENRAYIAMIYQKVLDLELQLENLGGGFNLKRKPREETVNPLMGTEILPSTQSP